MKEKYTIHGLQRWCHSEFEKLGWMVLAKERGHNYKIVSYKKGLDHLVQALESTLNEYQRDILVNIKEIF